MIGRLRQKNIPLWGYWVLVGALVALRLLVAASQRVTLLVGGAPLDDMLMINAARSLVNGSWLGAYSGLTIAKNMGFALWLALLHTLGVPMLVGNALLWVAASAFAVRAVRPLFPGNLARVLLFGFFCFQPLSYADFTMRAYRDGIFPAFCLLLFAGVVGLSLRLAQNRARGSLLMALGTGAGLAGCWLLREDGIVTGLFAIAGLLFVLGFAVFHRASQKRLQKALCCVLPFLVLAAGLLGFSAANYANYGVFMVNDLTSGSFPSAYGAMVGVSRAESGVTGRTPVSRDALDRLFAEVPSLALLEEDLVTGPAFYGYADTETGEFGGSLYYALRVAAGNAGLTPDAVTAQSYWKQVEGEINAAVAEGRLQTTGGANSIVPRFAAGYLLPTARETVYGALNLLLLEDVNPQPGFSLDIFEDETAAVARFLHEKIQVGYAENTDQPYLNRVQQIVFALCEALRLVYTLLIWPLLFLALVRTARALAACVGGLVKKRRMKVVSLTAVLSLGLLLSFVLRMVVAAYMEVASFGIGTYNMYLASGMPALLLFFVVGCSLPAGVKRERSRLLERRGGKRDLRRWAVVAAGLGLLAFKLLLASGQSIYLDLVESPIDDALMLNGAMSITAGSWLGEYGWLTLSKHSFFSLWLAFLHLVRIPYLLGGQLLWAGASLAGAWAMAPLFKRRWQSLALFGLLLFSPSSTANPEPFGFVTRVYRDNIYPALCLLCVAGMVGYALRYRKGLKSTFGWLLVCGLGLAAGWLTREDGWWILPFLAAAVLVLCITLLRSDVPHKLQKGMALCIPFVMLAVSIAGWAGMNQAYYGRFIISDFSSGEFADAYGAMTRVKPEEWDPKTSVTSDVRFRLYEAVPAFAELEQYLEAEDFLNRYAVGVEYNSGSFYWALREAAARAGYYETPETARTYWADMADAINTLCDTGVLEAGPRRSSVNPPIRAEYVLPVLGETFQNLWYTLTFQGCDARSLLSRDAWKDNEPAEAYLYEKVLTAAKEGTDEPYFSPIQEKGFRVLEVFNQVYAMLAPLMFLCGVIACVMGGVRLAGRLRAKKRNGWDALVWWVQMGLLFCILLRCAMIAYVSVSSFNIGVYIAYLASVHPLLLLFGFTGTVQVVKRLKKDGA